MCIIKYDTLKGVITVPSDALIENVTAEVLIVQGSLTFSNLIVDTLKVRGDLKGDKLCVRGGLEVQGNIQASECQVNGEALIGGSLNVAQSQFKKVSALSPKALFESQSSFKRRSRL